MATFPSQITLGQLPTYQYVTPPVFDTIAKSRHSIVQYNGLVMNDRRRPDRYYVTEIDGLGGPDIRDSREPRAAQHGEIPYDAYWGGNTLTIEGEIQAGNVMQATRMERDLEAAFGTLVESPLKLNWWDVHDEFSEASNSAAYWQELSGSVVFPGDGTMRFGSSGAIAYYALRQYIDHMVTAKVFVPIITANQSIGVIAKCTASNQYVTFNIGTTGQTGLLIGPNTPTYISFTPTPGVSYWIQLICIGDTFQGLVYDQDPFLTTASPVANSLVQTASGSIAQQYGYLQEGYAGVAAVGTSQMANIIVEDFRVDALWPSDFVQNVRPISAPAIKSVLQTSTNRAKSEFQTTVRASNPRWTSPWTQSASSLLGNANNPTQTLEVVNRGNWLAQPVILVATFGGNCQDPTITNLTNGDFTLLDTTITPGVVNGVTIASAQQTLFQNGSNVFDYYDPTSQFIQLQPGLNQFQIIATSGAVYCYIVVTWANTWK